MPAHAALACGALDVDVLVHALDVADGGVDAGGDGFNLQGDGVQTSVQRVEALPGPVLIVPEGDRRGVLPGRTLLRVCRVGTGPLPATWSGTAGRACSPRVHP